MTSDRYTTQLQAGLGLIQETRTLLDLWQPAMSRSELNQDALNSGRFPNVSARRIRNIVTECFAPRYLAPPGPPAIYLKQLSDIFTSQELAQLMFIFTCRANSILADFIREVYWQRYAAGLEVVEKEHAREFILRGIDDNKTSKRWADGTIMRVSGYLLGACADYGLLGARSGSGRKIIPFRIGSRVTIFLAHDLHFAGSGDNAVVSHEDWGLFGLDNHDVLDELKRASLQGNLIIQTAGEVIHIGWRYQSMQELVDVFVGC